MGQFIGGIILFLFFGGIAFALRRFRSNVPNEVAQKAMGSVSVACWIIGIAGGLALLVSSVVFSVPANHVGVEVLFGKPSSTHTEGLQIKNPFSEVAFVPGLQQESTYSAVASEGEKAAADAVEAVTNDNAVVDVDASILWSLDLSQAKDIYREYRTLDQVRSRLLRPVSRDVIRDCVARHAFEEARTSERQNIATCAEAAISAQTSDKGVIINAVQIRNMKAKSDELQASIDRKLAAEQAASEAEFRRQQAEVDAQTAKIRAQGEADAEIAKAQGVKEANRLVSESLTASLLEFRKYEFLSQSGNTNWVIDGSVGVNGPDLVIPMTDGDLAGSSSGSAGDPGSSSDPG